jgi:hypothetical protein
MHHLKITTIAVALLFGPSVQADLPGQGPRLGQDRIEQATIESGSLDLIDIRRAGLKIFSTPFNKLDGYGDGPMNPANVTQPGGRPTLGNNGTFLRVNGLDGQSCLECHSIISNASVPARFGIGGVGGSVSNAIFQPTLIDVSDDLDLKHAAMNGRFINPPFLFGSGGIELIAKEMTTELQGLKDLARQKPGQPVALETRGINFGVLVYDGVEFDVSAVEGIDADLVVRPFGRKGEFPTVRAFDQEAMKFHFGMQPVELVGKDVDDDGDGVVNEMLVGELSALTIFNTTLERPQRISSPGFEKQSIKLFRTTGCASCHRPTLISNSQVLSYSLPEVAEDPSANVFYEVNLAEAPSGFRKAKSGGIEVPLFSDLKRHDMGDDLEEFFGHPLDRQFITARLWGVADTAPYMHDGRALTLNDAILMHGGEAQKARDRYSRLAEEDKAKLLELLLSLRTPKNPAVDLSQGQD